MKRGLLQIVCSGNDCNRHFINSLGRIATKRVPSYAYHTKLINIENIERKTGYHSPIAFNNDMMRLRLSNTPVMNVDPKISYLHERYWHNVDYLDVKREKHEKEKNIEVLIDVKNTNDDNIENEGDILHVTTNDIKVYIDEKQKQIYSDSYPLLIISLKPKEAFKCSMKAVLGIGVNDTCWDACSNFYFDEETIEGKRIASFQAASQMDEYTLVSRALEYMRIRTDILKNEINRMYMLQENKTKRFQIVLKNEDHTMGEIINYEIQSHPDIRSSGCSKPDLLIREILIDVTAFSGTKLLNAINESMDNLLKKIDVFETQFNKLIPTKSTKKISRTKSKKKSKHKRS
jgi:DNA-directed RNA polymerase subunit L